MHSSSAIVMPSTSARVELPAPAPTPAQAKALEISAVHSRLHTLNLQSHDCGGRGDCQFHSISHQLKEVGGFVVSVDFLRQKAAAWMQDNYSKLSQDVDPVTNTVWLTSFGLDYATEFSTYSRWQEVCRSYSQPESRMGDRLSLFALAHVYNCKIITHGNSGQFITEPQYVIEAPRLSDLQIHSAAGQS